MTTTPNLGLKKPSPSDLIKISDLNDNADILDHHISMLEASELTMQQIFDAIPEIIYATEENPVDLNTVLTAGVYIVPAEYVSHVTNSPVTNDGYFIRIYYVAVIDSTKLRQEIIPIDSPGVTYARHNDSLTGWTSWSTVDAQQLAEDRAALVELVDGGAKNLIKLGFSTKTSGTVTGSMTSDGNGITVNGNRTQTTDAILVYDIITDKSASKDTRYTLQAGQYVLNATLSTVQVQVYCHDGASESLEKLAQSGTSAAEFVYTAEKKIEKPYICVRLWISRHHNYDNETIYPMICTAADWAISQAYVPYRPSYQELYEMVLALQGGSRSLQTVSAPEELEEPEEMR